MRKLIYYRIISLLLCNKTLEICKIWWMPSWHHFPMYRNIMKNVHKIVTLGVSTKKTKLTVHIYINLRMVYPLMLEKMPVYLQWSCEAGVAHEVFVWQETKCQWIFKWHDLEQGYLRVFFMHFCPGTMTTHAESINSDLQRGLDRHLRHTQDLTQNRTSKQLNYQWTTNTTATLVVKY